MSIKIRDMLPEDEYYVGTCTHVEENDEEIEECAQERIAYFKKMKNSGLKIKVALFNGQHAGFIYIFPIENSPWEVEGSNLYFIPCLVAHSKFSGNNIGRELLVSAKNEAKAQGKDGIVVDAMDWNHWFMPANYFIHLGYEIVRRKGREVLLWKRFNKHSLKPHFIEENYSFKKIANEVVVDLFYNTFCQTSAIEAKRVRSIVEEFGDKVILNEFSADKRSTCKKYGISRAIYINGRSLELKAEVDKNMLRQRIKTALDALN